MIENSTLRNFELAEKDWPKIQWVADKVDIDKQSALEVTGNRCNFLNFYL